MCGRFTLRAPASAVAEEFALLEVPELAPRFNIAPSQPVPVIRAAPERELVLLHWGLVPGWAKDPAIGRRMINARAETAAEKPAFRAALRYRRCLVVADGFYEWRKVGNARQPHFFRMWDDRPFAFAGLWEAWTGPDRQELQTCAILTTEANDLVRPVHDRMPVILAPGEYDRWLDASQDQPSRLLPLLRPCAAESMVAHPVSSRVNSPAHDDPACVAVCDG